MKRIAFISTWIAVLLVTTGGADDKISLATFVDADESGYFLVWDPVQDRMVAYRDVQDSTTPTLRVFSRDARSSTPIYVLKQLPDVREVSIWGVAGAPGGGVVIAAMLDYGEHRVKSVLLTFGGDGRLKKFWEVDPYHHHRVAVDREGNVFAFGDSHNPADSNYNLIVKYSPSSKILRKFLPGTTFEAGDEVVSITAATGEHYMFIGREELFLFLSTTKDLFRFSLSGRLLSRVSLAPVLAKLAEATSSARAELMGLALGSNELIAQVRFWPADPNGNPSQLSMVRMALDGSYGEPFEL
jgi:hypothetical protein